MICQVGEAEGKWGREMQVRVEARLSIDMRKIIQNIEAKYKRMRKPIERRQQRSHIG